VLSSHPLRVAQEFGDFDERAGAHVVERAAAAPEECGEKCGVPPRRQARVIAMRGTSEGNEARWLSAAERDLRMPASQDFARKTLTCGRPRDAASTTGA